MIIGLNWLRRVGFGNAVSMKLNVNDSKLFFNPLAFYGFVIK